MKSSILNLIIIVLMIPLLGITLWLVYSGQNKKSKTSTKLVVSEAAKAVAAEAPVISDKSLNTKKELTDAKKIAKDPVLVKESGFRVEYMDRNDVFMVTILEAPFDTNKAKAETWFKDKGFTSQELCLFRIYYIAPKEVKESFEPADSVSTGCTPPAQP